MTNEIKLENSKEFEIKIINSLKNYDFKELIFSENFHYQNNLLGLYQPRHYILSLKNIMCLVSFYNREQVRSKSTKFLKNENYSSFFVIYFFTDITQNSNYQINLCKILELSKDENNNFFIKVKGKYIYDLNKLSELVISYLGEYYKKIKSEIKLGNEMKKPIINEKLFIDKSQLIVTKIFENIL